MLDAILQLSPGEGGQKFVPGETLDASFDCQGSDLLEFGLEAQQDLSTAATADPGEGSADFFTFHIKKMVDAATPLLFKAFCNRLQAQKVTWKTATVTLRKASGGKPLPYLTFTFQNVYIKTWSLDSQSGDTLAEEDVEFCFSGCQIQYQPQIRGGMESKPKFGTWKFNAART